MDPLTLTSSILTSIKGAGKIAKSALDLKSAADNVELKEHLVNLREALVEAKDNILEVREALQEKDTRIKELEERLKRDKELNFNDKLGCYEADEKGKIVRYCLKCHVDGKYVPLKTEGSRFVCTACGKKYQEGSGMVASCVAVSRS